MAYLTQISGTNLPEPMDINNRQVPSADQRVSKTVIETTQEPLDYVADSSKQHAIE